VRYITCLWAGLDLGPDGHSGRKTYFSDNRQLARAVRSFPLNPSIIVESGTGMHLYWLLKTVTEIHDPLWVEEQLNKVNQYFQCKTDVRLDSTLRLPGTLNSKTPGQGLRCSVKFINPDFCYDLADFEQVNSSGVPGSISAVTGAPTGDDPLSVRSAPNRGQVNQRAADPSEELVPYFSENNSAIRDLRPGPAPLPHRGASGEVQIPAIIRQSANDIEPLPYEPEAAGAEPTPHVSPQRPSDLLEDRIVEKVVAKLADRLSDELVDQIVEKLVRRLRKIS